MCLAIQTLTANNSYEPNVYSIDLEMVQFVEIYQELYFTFAWYIVIYDIIYNTVRSPRDTG